MSKLSIFLLISFLILSIYYINNQPKENIPVDGDRVYVEYTDQGFDPKVLVIKKGQEVTFVNKSSSPMWVASDTHPTHEKFPEFDQRQGLNSEEEYKFTFNKIGSYEYHDHITPIYTGIINVTE